ncbi:MAG: hypothetical protein AMJ41_01495 [candidate division Zixibacteria bacterium DG_27]|nr:MAG: hypothetical protein AMJ41_01495 [candidate division Zixibacteria bacterium DG_27]
MLTTVIAAIVVLGPLIFFHELGHFLMAKRLGIKVERFSLGFPPKMAGFTWRGTEYCISWIPFGGYVKMAGETPDREEVKGEPWEFLSKPVWVRGLVIFAGPAANFITAILILWGVFFFAGQQIIRDDSTVIGSLMPEGAAEVAGLEVGDRILSVDGQEVHDFRSMAEIIYKRVEEPLEVVWERQGERFSATITTFKDEVIGEAGEPIEVGKIGIGPQIEIVEVGFFKALTDGIISSVIISYEILKFLFNLFTGAVSLKMIGGPLTIAQVAGETARQGFLSLLTFTALLSINLSLVNILPIPVLDGGHLLFLGVEAARRKPLSLKQRMWIQQVGMALLLLLMIFVTYNDILRLFE